MARRDTFTVLTSLDFLVLLRGYMSWPMAMMGSRFITRGTEKGGPTQARSLIMHEMSSILRLLLKIPTLFERLGSIPRFDNLKHSIYMIDV